MEGISQVLQFPVIIERSWSFSFDSQTAQEFDFMRSGIAGERRVLKKFPEPGFFVGLVGFSLHVSEFLGSPGASLRLSAISIPKVARSISQDSMSGSKNETQFSFDKLNTSVSRNSRMLTRVCS